MNTLSSETSTLHLVIHGKVQGVFYRDSMRQAAHHLGICGWVRNKRDGTVEAMVQGAPSAIDRIVQWAHHGPERARVERVEMTPAKGQFNGFEILG